MKHMDEAARAQAAGEGEAAETPAGLDLERLQRELDEDPTLQAILEEVRRGAAAQLLEGTDWPVAKVGRQCGFKEMGYFARAYREVYHCTPTEHRRAILQKKAGGTAIAP